MRLLDYFPSTNRQDAFDEQLRLAPHGFMCLVWVWNRIVGGKSLIVGGKSFLRVSRAHRISELEEQRKCEELPGGALRRGLKPVMVNAGRSGWQTAGDFEDREIRPMFE